MRSSNMKLLLPHGELHTFRSCPMFSLWSPLFQSRACPWNSIPHYSKAVYMLLNSIHLSRPAQVLPFLMHIYQYTLIRMNLFFMTSHSTYIPLLYNRMKIISFGLGQASVQISVLSFDSHSTLGKLCNFFVILSYLHDVVIFRERGREEERVRNIDVQEKH